MVIEIKHQDPNKLISNKPNDSIFNHRKRSTTNVVNIYATTTILFRKNDQNIFVEL